MDFVIGEVIASWGAPLVVLADGLALSGRDLWINEAMIPQRIVDEQPLTAGDRVVLLTTDHQTYYLICKVVRYE